MIIVTSGAVAVGSSHFNHLDRSLRVEEKQTAGAIGQVQLMRAYEQSLKRHSFSVRQILLTREDIDDQHRRLNAVSTLQRLLKVGAVPIINENDTTATPVARTRTCRRRPKSRCMEGYLCRDFLTVLLRARLADGSARSKYLRLRVARMFQGLRFKVVLAHQRSAHTLKSSHSSYATRPVRGELSFRRRTPSSHREPTGGHGRTRCPSTMSDDTVPSE
ncbi:hypothetical protein [Mesorhizobium sp. M0816]|uniref:amino acid kinase family protein n=1 Tax=Mesorhizobium sp. M0816 TaxID=2957006 RepID=UPI00333B7CF1